MTDNQPTASGVSEGKCAGGVVPSFEDPCPRCGAMSDEDCPFEAALSAKPAQTEQIASVRICVEWAIPQLNCGNMSKDEFFDYLISLFGTISAHEAVRDMQERWRRDKSERDHLRYVLSREPAQGGDTAAVREVLKDELKCDPETLMGEWVYERVIRAIQRIAPPQPIPTSDEALREGELLPCPFCGGEAEILNIEDGENAGGSCVSCKQCQASSNVEFEFKENFVSNWNRRAALSRARPDAIRESALVSRGYLALIQGLLEECDKHLPITGSNFDDDMDLAREQTRLHLESRARPEEELLAPTERKNTSLDYPNVTHYTTEEGGNWHEFKMYRVGKYEEKPTKVFALKFEDGKIWILLLDGDTSTMQTIRIYTTSKRRHAQKLMELRAQYSSQGFYFTARWIVTAQLSSESIRPVTHWLNDNFDDIIRSDYVVCYAEKEDILKTSLAEIGMAFAHRKRIYTVGDCPSYDPWNAESELVTRVPTLETALERIKAERNKAPNITIGRGDKETDIRDNKDNDKPFRGDIHNWYYYIDPRTQAQHIGGLMKNPLKPEEVILIRTTRVTYHHQATGMITTENSRYKLIGKELAPAAG